MPVCTVAALMVFLIKVPKGELMRTICSTALVSACAMRFVAASALVAAALCFSAVGVQAASAPLAGNTIYLGGQRAKELKMPVVAFDHAAHAKANACASCHAANPGVSCGLMTVTLAPAASNPSVLRSATVPPPMQTA